MALDKAEMAAFDTVTDAMIVEALKVANIPALMMVIIHLTGDLSLLDGPIRPTTAISGNVKGGLSSEEEEAVRAQALQAIKDYRQRGARPTVPLSADVIHRMMNFVVGDVVSDDYVPMMREEMGLTDDDSRAIHWTNGVPEKALQDYRVLVIGAGMSGLLAAIRLQQAGIPYVVIEKNDEVGGTWFENKYPGCRVDVPSHFYSYSFEPNHGWSQLFSQRDELNRYFNACAERYAVGPNIQFGTEVVELAWSDSPAGWTATLRRKDGSQHMIIANSVICAVGQLNRPNYPAIPGRESFNGVSLHSATWDRGVETAGKRIAVIGTGASAFQLVPAIAENAAQLTVFQRSPVWMRSNPDYHKQVPENKKWLLASLPHYAAWHRFMLFWPASDGLLPMLKRDPSWPHQERSVSAVNDKHRELFTAYIKQQVGDNEGLLAKLIPTYPPFVKRLLQDNGSWIQALKRDNVELVTDGIASIDATGIIDSSGQHHDVDVIAYATGFEATKFLSPMRIVGRDGVVLDDFWKDEPRAYLGITVPKFPNFFIAYGPGTNIGHGGSVIFMSECQVRYATRCIQTMIEDGVTAMDVTPVAYERYTREIEAALEATVWSHPTTNSWYKNARGKVVTTSPWRFVDYWSWTRGPDLDDYVLSHAAPAESAS